MNERIKDLADQASDHADTQVNTDECDSCGECEHCIDWHDVYNSKFAQLIIGHATECVRDVLRDENSDLSYDAASQVQNRIKEFFRVEE